MKNAGAFVTGALLTFAVDTGLALDLVDAAFALDVAGEAGGVIASSSFEIRSRCPWARHVVTL